MIEAYVTNLGKYNEGELRGEYLKLPATREELQALLSKIGVDGVRYEETFITDYESEVDGLTEYLGEYESIDELNYLASLLEEMDQYELERFAAAVEYGAYTNGVKDLLNLSQNLDYFEHYPDVHSAEDLGYYMVDELSMLEIPENVQMYFNYEAFGQDIAINEGGVFTDKGYITSNHGRFIEYYNSRENIPDEHRIFAYPPRKEAEVTMATPLIEDKHVQELLNILKKSDASQQDALNAVLSHVGKMEQQYEKMVTELAAMREQFAKAEAQNHPARTAMRNAIIAAQDHALKFRDNLSQLKQSIVEGCKRSISAFKEQGISALSNVARFFKIKPILETMRNDLDRTIQTDNKAIAKIEAISTEYHKAGRHLKNIGRAIIGKEAIAEVKPIGKVAKAFLAPSYAERSCCMAMKKHVESAIDSLTRLEERTTERKPSIQKTLQTLNEQIAQTKKDTPTKEHAQPAHENR